MRLAGAFEERYDRDVNAPSSSIHEFIQRPVSSDQVPGKRGVASPNPGVRQITAITTLLHEKHQKKSK